MKQRSFTFINLILCITCLLNLYNLNAHAASAERLQIATCDFGSTIVYLAEENNRFSYEQVTRVFNNYTNEYDVYSKNGEAQVIRVDVVSNRNYVFYLDGFEESNSPYGNDTFELDYISMVNGEMWIKRKNGGNRAITIHEACKIIEQQDLPLGNP
jgi:hypothetical protein